MEKRTLVVLASREELEEAKDQLKICFPGKFIVAISLSSPQAVKKFIPPGGEKLIITVGYNALHIFSGWRTLKRNESQVFYTAWGKVFPVPSMKTLNRIGEDLAGYKDDIIRELKS